ncbi:unnamed protein product [Amoebophrya sp. A120]|nr:unnamed protein product [Amoebophrya sp. A120]|eukprot:GSA120T00012198001.1
MTRPAHTSTTVPAENKMRTFPGSVSLRACRVEVSNEASVPGSDARLGTATGGPAQLPSTISLSVERPQVQVISQSPGREHACLPEFNSLTPGGTRTPSASSRPAASTRFTDQDAYRRKCAQRVAQNRKRILQQKELGGAPGGGGNTKRHNNPTFPVLSNLRPGGSSTPADAVRANFHPAERFTTSMAGATPTVDCSHGEKSIPVFNHVEHPRGMERSLLPVRVSISTPKEHDQGRPSGRVRVSDSVGGGARLRSKSVDLSSAGPARTRMISMLTPKLSLSTSSGRSARPGDAHAYSGTAASCTRSTSLTPAGGNMKGTKGSLFFRRLAGTATCPPPGMGKAPLLNGSGQTSSRSQSSTPQQGRQQKNIFVSPNRAPARTSCGIGFTEEEQKSNESTVVVFNLAPSSLPRSKDTVTTSASSVHDGTFPQSSPEGGSPVMQQRAAVASPSVSPPFSSSEQRASSSPKVAALAPPGGATRTSSCSSASASPKIPAAASSALEGRAHPQQLFRGSISTCSEMSVRMSFSDYVKKFGSPTTSYNGKVNDSTASPITTAAGSGNKGSTNNEAYLRTAGSSSSSRSSPGTAAIASVGIPLFTNSQIEQAARKQAAAESQERPRPDQRPLRSALKKTPGVAAKAARLTTAGADETPAGKMTGGGKNSRSGTILTPGGGKGSTRVVTGVVGPKPTTTKKGGIRTTAARTGSTTPAQLRPASTATGGCVRTTAATQANLVQRNNCETSSKGAISSFRPPARAREVTFATRSCTTPTKEKRIRFAAAQENVFSSPSSGKEKKTSVAGAKINAGTKVISSPVALAPVKPEHHAIAASQLKSILSYSLAEEASSPQLPQETSTAKGTEEERAQRLTGGMLHVFVQMSLQRQLKPTSLCPCVPLPSGNDYTAWIHNMADTANKHARNCPFYRNPARLQGIVRDLIQDLRSQ